MYKIYRINTIHNDDLHVKMARREKSFYSISTAREQKTVRIHTIPFLDAYGPVFVVDCIFEQLRQKNWLLYAVENIIIVNCIINKWNKSNLFYLKIKRKKTNISVFLYMYVDARGTCICRFAFRIKYLKKIVVYNMMHFLLDVWLVGL